MEWVFVFSYTSNLLTLKLNMRLLPQKCLITPKTSVCPSSYFKEKNNLCFLLFLFYLFVCFVLQSQENKFFLADA